MNYESSGVSLEKADNLTKIISKTVLDKNIGMFAGLFEHPVFKDYYLAACCDGVGTKIIPLLKYGMINVIANDVIAMNLNDLACIGAKPLFFLDYIAVNSIELDQLSAFISSLKTILDRYNCSLLGGETAELGDLIKENHFDVSGFAIGAVKKENLLIKDKVKENDIVIGLCSSGPHSNGFSLIRKLYDDGLINENDLIETLKPTNIYINEISQLCEENIIKAAAHITGGGIEGNLSRIIPKGLSAAVYKEKIPTNDVFNKIKNIVGEHEAFKVFNMGVGMCIIVDKNEKERVMDVCKVFNPFEFGRIEKNEKSCGVWLR